VIIIKRTVADIEALHGIKVSAAEIADDGTDYSDKRVTKPWGSEKEMYRDDKLSIWWLRIRSNSETSMHCHPNKSSILMIVGGTAQLWTLANVYELSAGDVAVIEKGAFHRTVSSGGNAVVLYEIEAPANKRDLVRLNDAYGRGQGYEHAS
jgi:mannose-6-phosphate isomerase-like protein (cupin superfamily)